MAYLTSFLTIVVLVAAVLAFRERRGAREPRGTYPCPCCFSPALPGRASFEICVFCGWQDDGQNDDDANEIFGGPNGNISLAAARRYVEELGVDGARKKLKQARRTALEPSSN
jgi:hypothetical protein